jgi:uncharacterized protein YbjT (DUF2867 family)
VRVASRDPEHARETLAGDDHVELSAAALDDVEVVAFDFDRPETYYPTLDGVDRLFFVRPPAVSRVERDLFPFVDAAARMGVAHVVFLSVLGAEKNRPTGSVLTVTGGENITRTVAKPACCRPKNVSSLSASSHE